MRGIQPHNVKNVDVSAINRLKIGFCPKIRKRSLLKIRNHVKIG